MLRAEFRLLSYQLQNVRGRTLGLGSPTRIGRWSFIATLVTLHNTSSGQTSRQREYVIVGIDVGLL